MRIAVAGASEAADLAATVRAAQLRGVTDVVGGAATVVALFDPSETDLGTLEHGLRRLRISHVPRRATQVVIQVCFDGEDLHDVGERSGLGEAGVRSALLAADLRVSFLGFAPGFAYLTGLPRPLADIPRRLTPRSVVPAGSFAIGGGHAAVYPRASPGGWHIVGRSDAVLFDPARAPYSLLAPGDRVRLREVGPEEVESPVPPAPGVLRHTRPVLVVERPGLFTTFQDTGRPGLAHLGVPRSGAADRVCFALGNALVGNEPGAACLEVTALGPELRATADCHVAVVGSETEVRVDGKPVGCGRVVPVAAGQRLSVGSSGWHLRAYLAVRGGFDVAPVLGSRSTDRLGGLGPAPLGTGDELGLRDPSGPMADHLVPGAPGSTPPEALRRLRALRAPTPAVRADPLFGRPLRVEEPSDRIGVRLVAVDGAIGSHDQQVPSGGTTVGTIQIPPSGSPVALLADHAPLGGYPVGAVVISADVAELARLRPGDTMELVEVGREDALAALAALDRSVRGATAGRYPLRAD